MSSPKITKIGHWDGQATGRVSFDDSSSWPILGDPDAEITPVEWRSLGQAYLHLIEIARYRTHKDAVAALLKVRRALKAEGRR